MKRNDIECTTKYATEISTEWMVKNPELFVDALEDFTSVAIQNDLFHVQVDISRVGFLTFTATRASRAAMKGE